MDHRVIEELIGKHDRVARSAVVNSSEHQGHTVVYVVPYEAPAENRVEEWLQVYDRLYTATPSQELGDNFTGWNSTYDRTPIPLAHMRNWRDNTVARIRELSPRRVLEIGAGNGLVLTKLAPHCDEYWATDLSPVAIAELEAQVKATPDLASKVILRAQPADDFRDVPAGYFDTIVINSVVQLFPSADYLLSVLRGARRALAPGGALFLGDIRDLRTLPYLQTAAALTGHDGDDSVAVLRRAERIVARSEELLLHPAFFSASTIGDLGFGGVDTQLKRSPCLNELTRHRFDVVLHSDDASPTNVAHCPVVTFQSDLLDVLPGVLTGPVRITGIPNRRILGEITAYQALRRGEPRAARQALGEAPGPSIEPHRLIDLAETAGAQAVLTPDHADAGLFEAIFLPRLPGRTALTGTYRCDGATEGPLAEIPAATRRKALLANELHEWLRERLPRDVLPAAVIPVDTLPTTSPSTPGGPHGSR